MKGSGAGVFFSIWSSPVGWIGVVQGEQGLREIVLHPRRQQVEEQILRRHGGARPDEAVTAGVRKQFEAFFLGRCRRFDLLLDFSDLSPFTVKVLRALAEVEFAETVTYGALARRIGHPRAARAVGRAMACNPFPLVLPCHRVVGAGGRMTGYSGGEGIATKERLLHFERSLLYRVSPDRKEIDSHLEIP